MIRALMQLIPGPEPQPAARKWATVTSVAPLRVLLDTETTPLDGAPSALAAVSVGDRVYVELDGRRATIIGKAAQQIDSGVVTLTPLKPFDGATTEGVTVARYGRQVTLSLIVKTSASSTAQATILTLPTGWCPAQALYPQAYAATANLGVYPNGIVTCWTALNSGVTVRIALSFYTADAWPTPTA